MKNGKYFTAFIDDLHHVSHRKYNGCYGHIDNKLQFSTLPPPNTRTHIPNYSPSMNAILADKMDVLESWGVLVEPESMGVSVEYVSPVPYRL